jgi:hypothetical protein
MVVNFPKWLSVVVDDDDDDERFSFLSNLSGHSHASV